MTPTDKELVEQLEYMRLRRKQYGFISGPRDLATFAAAIQRIEQPAKELEAVREAERERCAKWHEEEAASLRKVESNYAWQTENRGENLYTRQIEWHTKCATAIRARKEQGNR